MSGLPFIHRHPEPSETARLQLAMSVFRDGSGQERERDGSTRAGWREVERIVAEVLGGSCRENKDIFDVLVPNHRDRDIYHGISVKTKELSRRNAISVFGGEGRVFMELCNPSAKLWEALKRAGISEDSFATMTRAEEIGNSILATVHDWHNLAKRAFEKLKPRACYGLKC
ncbi:hypothetical protein SAMN05421753_103335 [Planctomicrobium piriforme]|uniref:Uncharacterized protein n=1 Tax=Planctomicrobium piriforme TaxID=1576369 RepID=A0A1I3DNM4_9PLAN|nr:hypothetical protein SAMN05421753_103335 [Planctomicrobium piriforme]